MLTFTSIFLALMISIAISVTIGPKSMLEKFHNKERFGVVNVQGKMAARAHYIAGTAFFPIILMATGLVLLLDMRMNGGMLPGPQSEQMLRVVHLLTGMAALYLVGIKDDLTGTPVSTRVLIILFAALLFPISGLWINNLYGMFGVYALPYWVGMPFTVVLVMYLVATINLTDGIYGMASCQCSISLGVVVLFSWLAGSYMTGIVACAALGVTATFFVRRLIGNDGYSSFMGSSGSLPLGYLICFVILYIYKVKEWVGVADGMALAAFCTMLIPAWDMLRVLRSRFAERRSITRPDRNMLNHKLTRAGMGPKMILVTLVIINMLFVIANGYLMNHKVNITLILIADIIVFVGAQWVINYFIARNSRLKASMVWEKSYGKDNWSDDEYEDALAEMGLQQAAKSILMDKETPRLKMEADTPQMAEIAFIPDGMNAFERNVKRILDCCWAGASLVLFSPLFLLSYIMIKLDDGGPAIFRQERIGRFGRPFYIYKFRSMRLDAEKLGPQLSHASGNEDDRLTKAGRFLRAHHLDELPQLWNVFNGDMAFIGYRPERQFFISQIAKHDPRYHMLYQIRPGVTSYATLYNGYTDTMEKMLTRLELDLYYLKHRSWWFDAKILFLTFWHIVGGKKF